MRGVEFRIPVAIAMILSSLFPSSIIVIKPVACGAHDGQRSPSFLGENRNIRWVVVFR
jgi:hypothetical protein